MEVAQLNSQLAELSSLKAAQTSLRQEHDNLTVVMMAKEEAAAELTRTLEDKDRKLEDKDKVIAELSSLEAEKASLQQEYDNLTVTTQAKEEAVVDLIRKLEDKDKAGIYVVHFNPPEKAEKKKGKQRIKGKVFSSFFFLLTI